MKQTLTTLVLLLTIVFNMQATSADSIYYHHQPTDTAIIHKILRETRMAGFDNPADRLVYAARKLVNTPYKSGTLEGTTEQLTINMSELDCTTLVENAIALAFTAAVDTAMADEFAQNLRNIRYRGGVVNGYASRLHYVSDWIADNTARGNFSEVTSQFAKASRATKTINYMTTHRRSYPALLASDTLFEQMKKVESDWVNYRYHYIPVQLLASEAASSWFKNGDIVLFTTSTKGLDVSHMGIIVIERGVPYLLHASSKARRVVVEKQSLYNYVTSNNVISGVRIVRL